MGSGRRVRISQCMIVKNEEQNIQRALAWGKAVMWEQIVVDTGSGDRTAELAKEAGAKVFYHAWADDFAEAKNYAIERAKGDWIALLDADEYMMPEDAAKLQDILDGLPPGHFDGISTGWQQLDDEGQIFSSGTQIRFFRNDPDIRYRRRIHEQLETLSGRPLKVGDVVNDISIFHTGYQSRSLQEKTKNDRNKRLILKELEDHPDSCEMMGYMGDEYFGEGDREKAKEWYQRAVQGMPAVLDEYDQRSAFTFTRLLIILAEEKNTSEEALQEIYEKAVRLLPKEADFDYIIGNIYAARGAASEACACLESAVRKLEEYGCGNRALLLAANLLEAYGLLARCCHACGKEAQCVQYAAAYLQHNKYEMAVLSCLLQALLAEAGGTAQDQFRAVLELLSKIYDTADRKDRLFLVKTSEKAGQKEFAGYAAAQLLTQEEQEKAGL